MKNPVLNEEMTKLMGDFLWLGSGFEFLSVLWHYWLDDRKDISP